MKKGQTEGYIKVKGGRIWYNIVGKKNRAPLILVHGGPGYPHNYLTPLQALSHNRSIVFYDQLGCGRSDRPQDLHLWTVDRFVDELATVIAALDFDRYHLLGQSWGAALAVSYALHKPKGLVSLILSDPYLSTPLWEADADQLIKTLPKHIQAPLRKHMRGHAVTAHELHHAMNVYYQQFVYRLDPLPEAVKQSEAGMNTTIYQYMWGPTEYTVNGTLKNLDLLPQLSNITIPVLLLAGETDEVTIASLDRYQKKLAHAEKIVFADSAHFPFWTAKTQFLATVSHFLSDVEN